MPTMTVFPLGNADSYRLDLAGGEKMLFDYANMRDPQDPNDKRIDLEGVLRADLRATGRTYFDVVAFTHLDDDHIHGATDFFELWHAQKYQGGERIQIKELWVPAAAIVEQGIHNEDSILRAEARHRLIKGKGIRVFSRPDSLKEWLNGQGISLEDRKHLITNAGEVVTTFNPQQHGVEFFAHSPFAEHAQDGALVDRNKGSLVLHATFTCAGYPTYVFLGADITYEPLSAIIRITKYHGREERLLWNVVKIPHHCSYKSLGLEQGAVITVPDPDVAWLYEEQGYPKGILVSTSKPIPSNDDDKQPPHRQAAAYYSQQAARLQGDFLVTMEHPDQTRPAPLVITIDHLGATVKKPGLSGSVAVTSVQSPRAG